MRPPYKPSESVLLYSHMSIAHSFSGGPGWIWTWENNYADILLGTLRRSVRWWRYCAAFGSFLCFFSFSLPGLPSSSASSLLLCFCSEG